MIATRATFGYIIYSFTLTVAVALTHIGRLPRGLRLACGAVLALMVGKTVVDAAYGIPRMAAYERALIEEARAGKRLIVQHEAPPYGYYNHGSFLVANSSGMHNRALAAYYGVPRFGVCRAWEYRMLNSVPAEAYARLRQPGEYCRAAKNVILIRLPQEPTSCLVSGYLSPGADYAQPRCWGRFATALKEQEGIWYLLVFYSSEADALGLPELRLRLIEGHSWHWLTLDPRRRHGVLTIL